MKNITKILIFIALLISSATFGQAPSKCDSIYNFVEKMPQYKNGTNELMDYLNVELVPIISNCMKRDNDIIASLYIILTIDKNGRVIDAIFSKPNLTNQCKSDLKKKLLTMTGWKPGKMNERNVCTHFYWPINCLKWND